VKLRVAEFVHPHPRPHELLELHDRARAEALAVGLDTVVGRDVPVVVVGHEPREQLGVDAGVVGEGLELQCGQLLDLFVGVETQVAAAADLLADPVHHRRHIHPPLARRPL